MRFRTRLNTVPPFRTLGIASVSLSLILSSGLSAQATFTVNAVDDADDGTCDVGHCSLREAITAANHAVDGGIIHFNIPGAGPHTIQPLSALPSLEGDVIIDGTSEPDFAGSPVIELDGSLAGGAHGLDLVGSQNLIRGLVINRFAWNGISVNTDCTFNVIEGNFIGTDVTGTLDLGNGNAGVLIGQAANNTVGGTTAAARNLISGNPEGVTIVDPTATENVVAGNYIGTDVTGTLGIPNGTGVLLLAPDNTVGGTASGSGNLISGNTGHGIRLEPPNATGNDISGNYMGVDATGTLALGNDIGVWVDNVADNVIGGTSTGARNLISGNREGITFWESGATGNLVQGNYIGTNASGDAAVPNDYGIVVFGPGNTLGGTEAGAGNLISGNQLIGINLFGENASGNSMQGNLIGTNAAGTAALGNGEQGVALVDAAGNTIGGTAPGAGNVLSGNAEAGVFLLGAPTTDNVIQGNLIGTDLTGAVAIGNGDSGIAIHGAASDNLIGGTESGARNILSGNTFGILMTDLLSTGNLIQGNYIGTNAAGDATIPNTQTGILLWGEDNTIGGSEAGAGNVISGNSFAGIDLGGGSSTTLIQGNYIGTDGTGTAALGNDLGIFLNFSHHNTIGGTSAGAGNVISGNTGGALTVNGLDATGNILQGNYIGTDFTGTAAVGNGQGIQVLDAPGNTFGGTQSGARNVISGNAGVGLSVTGVTATGNTIQGNYIGTDASGTVGLEGGRALQILDAPGNTIGGIASGAGNLIAGNGNGILIDGLNASGNVVQGNSFGVDVTGLAPLENGGAAVRLSNGAAGNTIGGSASGAGNIIANSRWMGVILFADAGTGNRIQSNAIFDNSALGIELGRNSVTLNDEGDADTGPNDLQNYPVLTSVASSSGAVIQASLNSAASSAFTVEFFSNPACDDSGYGQGQTPLGTATLNTDASGNGTVAASFSSVTGTVFTATATDANGNTSEFSLCSEGTTLAVSSSPTTQSVTPGQSATYTITVSAQGGTFEETVGLSCSGAPSGTTCTFTEDELDLTSGQASTTMTVTTVAPATSTPVIPRRLPGNPLGWFWALLLSLPGFALVLRGIRTLGRQGETGLRGGTGGTLGVGSRLMTRAGWGVLAVFGGVLLVLQTSCGSEGTSPPTGGTAAGSYELTVTATWESVQQTGTATLVVQ